MNGGLFHTGQDSPQGMDVYCFSTQHKSSEISNQMFLQLWVSLASSLQHSHCSPDISWHIHKLAVWSH